MTKNHIGLTGVSGYCIRAHCTHDQVVEAITIEITYKLHAVTQQLSNGTTGSNFKSNATDAGQIHIRSGGTSLTEDYIDPATVSTGLVTGGMANHQIIDTITIKITISIKILSILRINIAGVPQRIPAFLT